MSEFNPYLNLPGNTEEAFNFYKSVFGGEFAGFMRFGEMGGEGLSEEDKNKIMHVALPVGKGNILMGTDAIEAHGQKPSFGNYISICISPDSREESDRLFAALSEGGKVETPMTDMPWGGYFGNMADKFGVLWMIHHDNKEGSSNGA